METETVNGLGTVMRQWLDGRLARSEISPLTHNSYHYNIEAFIEHFGEDTDPNSITVEQIESWIAGLRSRHSGRRLGPASLNNKTATLRVFFAWALRRGFVDVDPMLDIRRAKIPKRPPRWIPPDQVLRVLSNAPTRARAMIILSLQLGLRRSEIAGLDAEDWNREAGFLYVRGKGAKDRELPMTIEAAEAAEAWLCGRLTGPMWPSSHNPGEGLSRQSVGLIMTKAATEVGLDITPHAYRHTAATDTLRGGGSLETVRRLLGHETYAPTSNYVHSRPEDLRPEIEGRRYTKADRR